MRRLLFILFILTTSLTSFQSVFSKDKNKQIRMSISGIWNGERYDTFDVNEGYLDDSDPVSIYTVDRTCLEIKQLELKGNCKNVTIRILCNDGTEIFSKNKVNIKGKFKLSIPFEVNTKCSYNEGEVQNRIEVVQNGEPIYICNLYVGECEG